MFKLLVVDLLHEIELGVWKGLLTHLIRILESLKGDQLREFNKRYVSFAANFIVYTYSCSFHQLPPFGRDTIRRFAHNVSEMKKLGARDFEDILQVFFFRLQFL